jgi:hypothetical protein
VDGGCKKHNQEEVMHGEEERVPVASKVAKRQDTHRNHEKHKHDLYHEHGEVVRVRVLMQRNEIGDAVEHNPVPQPANNMHHNRAVKESAQPSMIKNSTVKRNAG